MIWIRSTILKCRNDKHSLQQGKMIMMLAIVATLATLLVSMTVTEVFAATNLNSSKSNIYRSTQNAQSNEGGSVQQRVQIPVIAHLMMLLPIK